MNVCILFGYIKKCRKEGVTPTKEGLCEFKKLWK